MSDSVQPHRRQPTRLLCPWDSPGKNTGVGCHFLLQCMKVKSQPDTSGPHGPEQRTGSGEARFAERSRAWRGPGWEGTETSAPLSPPPRPRTHARTHARKIDTGSIPESGRSPVEVHGNALQYSCLENPLVRGAYQAPPSMGFSRQEYWSGVPLPSPTLSISDPIIV